MMLLDRYGYVALDVQRDSRRDSLETRPRQIELNAAKSGASCRAEHDIRCRSGECPGEDAEWQD